MGYRHLLTLALAMSMAMSASNVFAHDSKERKLFVGKDATEATMTFHHQVWFAGRSKPGDAQAKKQIESQLDHLFGPMGEAQYKAVPKGDHQISNMRVTWDEGHYIATYDYKGTIVLQNRPASEDNGPYDIKLPRDPQNVYEAGFPAHSKVNPCTDHHYQSEGDFWYFWNPENPGCPLKDGVDYDILQANIERKANTQNTFPDYPRLRDGNKDIAVHILFGMDDPDHDRNPLNSEDVNAENFRSVRDNLASMGYEGGQMSDVQIQAILDGSSVRKLPYVEEYSKKIGSDRVNEIRVRLFFGPSGISEDSHAFHYFFKDALANASVMMYDGHSGLGGHLDVDSIESIEQRSNAGFELAFNKDRYQIYFFNSCSSYPYYNTMYFSRKQSASDPKGTKNLDIFTNGLSTYFSVMDRNLVLVRAIDSWAQNKGALSYKKIAEAIDSGNLFGVNGDEDNPTEPPRD